MWKRIVRLLAARPRSWSEYLEAVVAAAVAVVVAAALADENGDRSVVGIIVGLGAGAAVLLLARWNRNDPSADDDERSS